MVFNSSGSFWLWLLGIWVFLNSIMVKLLRLMWFNFLFLISIILILFFFVWIWLGKMFVLFEKLFFWRCGKKLIVFILWLKKLAIVFWLILLIFLCGWNYLVIVLLVLWMLLWFIMKFGILVRWDVCRKGLIKLFVFWMWNIIICCFWWNGLVFFWIRWNGLFYLNLLVFMKCIVRVSGVLFLLMWLVFWFCILNFYVLFIFVYFKYNGYCMKLLVCFLVFGVMR